jgi:hypothetical protein
MAKETLAMPLYTGWFKVWRQTFAHTLFANDTFSRREAWFDLIGQAAFEGPEIGTLTASLRYLASRWRWSIKAVRCYIQLLEKEGMISRKIGAQVGAQVGAHLTICNYTEYQSIGHTLGHSEGHKDKKRRRKNSTLPKKVELSASADVPPKLSISEAFVQWNTFAQRVGLPQASKLTPGRKRAIAARLREHGSPSWNKALMAIEASAFLQGGNDRGWVATLDFVAQASSFAKLIDGAYGNGSVGQDRNSFDYYRRLLGEDRGH